MLSIYLLALLALPAEGPQARFLDDPRQAKYGWLEILGVPAVLLARLEQDPPSLEEWRRYALVTVGTGTTPVLGSYRVGQGRIVFQPRFPPLPGVTYQAVVRLDLLYSILKEGAPSGEIRASLAVPSPDLTPATEIESVYPTADRLPMNILRMYIHFSAPMSRDQAYGNIRVVDDEGKTVEEAFLEMTPELWDADTQRFTLLFDPGRIKRGLQPHESLGLPLQAGRSYRLVIDADWRDVQGRPLKKSFERPFQVLEPDRHSPNLESWRLEPPSAGSREPLVIDFGEPLDSGLSQRLIRVLGPSGETLTGRISLSRQESVWNFHPDSPWQPGGYDLSVDAWLEDLAGNNLNRPFDLDLQEQTLHQAAEQKMTHTLSFRIAN